MPAALIREKVEYGHRHGLIVGKHSQRDATVAINIYLRAAGRANRWEVHKPTSLGNRWAALAGRYPLLLAMYRDVAERIMYISSCHLPTSP